MINQCGNITFQGLSKCAGLMKDIDGIIVSNADTAQFTLAELQTITKVKGYLSDENGIVAIYIPLHEYDDTTEDPKFETGASGIRMKIDDGMPQATAYTKVSLEDYATFFGFDFSSADVIPVTKDGYFVVTPMANTKYQGFRGTLNIRKGIPKTKDNLKMYPLYISFEDLMQWENMEAIQVPFTMTDLKSCVPVGLNIQLIGEMSSGDQVVLVTTRASNQPKTGVTDFNIITGNVITPAITFTDDGAGQYTLTCTKATSTDLATNDFIYVQALIVATTTVTYGSNIKKINGKT